MLDIKSDLDVVQDIAPAVIKTTTSGGGADLAGYDAAMAVITPGTITDGTHTPALEESADNSTWTAVAAADMIGSLAAIASDTVQRVGYIGTQRYIRITVTVTGSPATGGAYGTVIVRGKAKKGALA